MGEKVDTSSHPAGVDELRDLIEPRPVVSSRTVFQGRIWDIRREVVDLGEAGQVTREFVRHPGAVAILALDDNGRIAMVHQYRHPVGALDWEIPAGLLDVEGEPPVEAAARELLEEADLTAGRWDVLVDFWLTPGSSSETMRVFLARDLAEVPEVERHEREGEELGMPLRWVSLDQAREAVLAGRFHNPGAVVGILAAHAARDSDWTTLRPADSPWPEHPAYRA